ncbi:MAG: HAD family phosphatase [Oscillospiraceae bacterium]|nr:HAD family phosphatase [Oscillospiraceae bacterium]
MIDFGKYRGAIFDVDGTMLDSMGMWIEAEAQFPRMFGIEPKPDLAEALRTLSQHEASEYFKSEYGIEKSVQEITDEKNALMEECYYEKAQLKPGVVEVLEDLQKRGFKMCVATATDSYLVEAGMRRVGIMKYFERIFTCGELNTTKRESGIFVTAAKFLGTEISETLVFEDAVHAVESAKKAGFPVVAVYDEAAKPHQEEIRSLADYYYVTMDEMLTTA